MSVNEWENENESVNEWENENELKTSEGFENEKWEISLESTKFENRNEKK
jgi:hypothetical protein